MSAGPYVNSKLAGNIFPAYNALMQSGTPQNDRDDRDDRDIEAALDSSAGFVRLDRQVRRLNQGLSSVHKTTSLLTGPMNLQQVLEIVVQTVAESLDADAAALRLLDEDSGQLILKATYGLSDAYKNQGPVTAGESTLNMRALSGEAIIVDDMRTDPHFYRYHAEIEREGLVSNLSIGLMYREKGIGILRLYTRHRQRFGPADISLARTVAAQSAAAIVNARLYADAIEGERVARQVRLAGAVQRHLIPQKPPQIAGLDIGGLYVPCYDVGGDFYDFIELPDGGLLLVIGDVMGKGVPASLAMASLRATLRAYAEQIEELSELLGRVNSMFCRDVEYGNFATLFLAKIDRRQQFLTYCNCGHDPPILMHNGRPTDLADGGTILGVDRDNKYHAKQLPLNSSDMLLMYTDGLAEAVNFQRESFGRKRIIQAAIDSVEMPAQQAAKNILWMMRKFTGLTERFDDTAVVVIKKS